MGWLEKNVKGLVLHFRLRFFYTGCVGVALIKINSAYLFLKGSPMIICYLERCDKIGLLLKQTSFDE